MNYDRVSLLAMNYKKYGENSFKTENKVFENQGYDGGKEKHSSN